MTTRRSGAYKIGITGSTCTGKTLVRNMLQRLGVSTLDVEETMLSLLSDNPQGLTMRLAEHFGPEVTDSRGQLSRKKLAAVVYTDPAKKAFFEDKLSPLLREEIKRFLYSPMGSPIRAVEAPMILETDTKHLYDDVWMITANPEIQIKRIMKRDHLTRVEAQFLIDSQWPQEKKASLCDRVIENSGDVQPIETQVRTILDDIRRRIHMAKL